MHAEKLRKQQKELEQAKMDLVGSATDSLYCTRCIAPVFLLSSCVLCSFMRFRLVKSFRCLRMFIIRHQPFLSCVAEDMESDSVPMISSIPADSISEGFRFPSIGSGPNVSLICLLQGEYEFPVQIMDAKLAGIVYRDASSKVKGTALICSTHLSVCRLI